MKTLRTQQDIIAFADTKAINTTSTVHIFNQGVIRPAYLKTMASEIIITIPESMHQNTDGKYITTPATTINVAR